MNLSSRKPTLRHLRIAVAGCLCVTTLVAIPCFAYPSVPADGSSGDTQLLLDGRPSEDSSDKKDDGGKTPSSGGTSGIRSRGYADLSQTGVYARRERVLAFLLAGESLLLFALVLKRDEEPSHGWIRV